MIFIRIGGMIVFGDVNANGSLERIHIQDGNNKLEISENGVNGFIGQTLPGSIYELSDKVKIILDNGANFEVSILQESQRIFRSRNQVAN